MTVRTEDIGKKFGKYWVFRHLNLEFREGERTAITGNNGSGKSTLLQIISGYLTPSEGTVYLNESKVGIDDHYKIGYSAPYVEIPEEFSFQEFLHFHSNFRVRLHSFKDIADKSNLPLSKPIKDFSTGMKQRVQLCTLFYFENEILFMDEPTANLDEAGFNWWKNELEGVKSTTIIASNQSREIETCPITFTLS